MKIRTKLLIAIFSLSLVPIFVMSLFTIYSFLKFNQMEKGEHLQSLVVSESEQIKRFFEKKIKMAKRMSQNEQLVNELVRVNETYLGKAKERIKKEILAKDKKWILEKGHSPLAKSISKNALSRVLKSHKSLGSDEIGEIFVTDRWGANLAMTSVLTNYYQGDEGWWKHAYADGKGAVFLDDRGYDQSMKSQILGIAVPVMHQDRAIGVLKINIKVNNILNDFYTTILEGRKAVYLIRSQGDLLAERPDHQHLGKQWEDLEFLRQKKAGWQKNEHNGEKILMAYSPILLPLHARVLSPAPEKGIRVEKWESTTWFLVVEVMEAELIEATYRLAILLLIIVLVVAGLVVLCAYFVSGKLVAPLDKLSAKLADFDIENLNTKFEIESQDEIGAFSRNFDEMIGELKSAYDQLKRENVQRIEAQEDLRHLLEDLETRIKMRTLELVETNQKLLEENQAKEKLTSQLIESQALLDRAQQITKLGHWKLELTGEVSGSDELFKIFGLNKKDFGFESFAQRVHEKDRDFVLKKIQEAIDQGKKYNITHRLKMKDGTEKMIQAIGEPTLGEDGKTDFMIGTVQDITQLMQAEAKLKSNEAMLRTITTTVNSAILMMDDEGKIVFWNRSAEKIFGYLEDEAIGFDLHSKIVPERYRERFRSHFSEFVKTGQGRLVGGTVEIEGLLKNGTEVPMELSLSSVQIDKRWHAVGVLQEISERKKSDEKLTFQASLLEQVHNAIITVDMKNQVLSWNRYAEELYQWTAGEAIGRNIVDLLAPVEHKSATQQSMAKLKEEGSWEGDYEANRKDGSKVSVHIINTTLKNTKGEQIGFIGISEDITEKKLLEKQVRQSQKMEAIGTLASGIAHDFNNILFGILGYLAISKKKLSPDNVIYDYLGEAIAAGNRAKDLVHQILVFSRSQESQLKSTNISLIIKEVVKMLRSMLPSTISIKTNIQPNIDNIEADPTQIHQIIVNLSTNAHYAMMEKGGVLRVELKQVVIDSEMGTRLGLTSGAYVRLCISDTGSGINKEDLERIYDPFFTTKPTGEGTGLGLSVVHGIVKNHHGAIHVESQPDQGARFEIYFPVFNQVTSAMNNKDQRIYRGDETILLVEDEKSNLRLIHMMLKDLGYQILTATNGREALAIYKEQKDGIDLVLTDLTMPQLSGDQLMNKIHKIDPQLPIIIMSGYNISSTDQEIKSPGIFKVVHKPFDETSISQEIRIMLDIKKRNQT